MVVAAVVVAAVVVGVAAVVVGVAVVVAVAVVVGAEAVVVVVVEDNKSNLNKNKCGPKVETHLMI